MSQSIGVFDSGVGGFTVYQACVKRYPQHSFVLLADQMHLPYGDKSKEELHAILDAMMDIFRSLSITTILIACNTLSSLLDAPTRQRHHDLTLISIIEPTLTRIPKQGSLMLLATQATLQAGKYQAALLAQDASRVIIPVNGRQLAKHIEDGDEEHIQAFLTTYVFPHQVDFIVLACTHYPLIGHKITNVMDVTLIDSIDAMSDMVQGLPQSCAPSRIYATANASAFAAKISRLFHENHEVHVWLK